MTAVLVVVDVIVVKIWETVLVVVFTAVIVCSEAVTVFSSFAERRTLLLFSVTLPHDANKHTSVKRITAISICLISLPFHQSKSINEPSIQP